MAKYIDIESLVIYYSGHTPDDEFSKGVDFVLDLMDSKQPADVVSWSYLERYANWFCADVSFPEFIREAKTFLKASGGFQEGSEN